MNILSLFDGMSCGQIAINNLGIKHKYYASEIDKFAIKVTQKNYPNTIQLGDVSKIQGKDLPKIDLIMGGSPCTGFSICGKGLNFDDPQSKLFWEFARLVKECKPKYFLLENVSMKPLWETVITNEVGVQPVEINSSHFSAQCRKRLYWTNIQIPPLPAKNTQTVQDIQDNSIKGAVKTDHEFFVSRRRDNTEFRKLGYFYKDKQGYRIYSNDKKAVTLCSQGGGLAGSGSGLYVDLDYWESYYVPLSNTKLPCYPKIHKLTSVEMERLQNVPDNYTDCVSESQRGKMLGNGWTVGVIEHILSGI